MGKILSLEGKNLNNISVGNDEKIYPVCSVYGVYCIDGVTTWNTWFGNTTDTETLIADAHSGGERGRIWTAIRQVNTSAYKSANDIATSISTSGIGGAIDTQIAALGYTKSSAAVYIAGEGINIAGNQISLKMAGNNIFGGVILDGDTIFKNSSDRIAVKNPIPPYQNSDANKILAINSSGTGYEWKPKDTVPVADTDTAGIVKIGAGLHMNGDTLNAVGGYPLVSSEIEISSYEGCIVQYEYNEVLSNYMVIGYHSGAEIINAVIADSETISVGDYHLIPPYRFWQLFSLAN